MSVDLLNFDPGSLLSDQDILEALARNPQSHLRTNTHVHRTNNGDYLREGVASPTCLLTIIAQGERRGGLTRVAP